MERDSEMERERDGEMERERGREGERQTKAVPRDTIQSKYRTRMGH